jgi:tripartite ATP-independent transporter DctM subunit
MESLFDAFVELCKANPTWTGVIGILVMLAIFMTRMPVAYVMALVGYLGFSVMISPRGGLSLLSRSIYETFASYGLTTIPLFILMGQLAFNCGIGRRLYDSAYKFMGSTRGGLAMATVTACTAFGAVCGSSPATAATMATVGLPEMKRYGYGDALSAGSVASGGGLGMIMPPSVVLIVYGILTEQSIGALFVSGIFPAIVITVLFILCILIWCRFEPGQGPPGEKFSIGQKIRSLSGMGDTLLVFLLVMGGLFFGLFTPTEAAAVGAFGVLAVALIRRQIGWSGIVKSLYETLRTSCMVMFLIAGAVIFGKFLAVTRIPFNLAAWIGALDLPAYLILTAIVAVYFIGGCVMDALALVMLTIPIFYPVILNLGYDPIWFGVIIVLVTQMGVITPPVGINVYVVYGVSQTVVGGIPLERIFRGILPFLVAIVAGIVLMVIFPQIILYLPNLMY